MMMRSKRWVMLLVLIGVLLNTTGCRYMTNRYYDFRDTWALGVGISTENSSAGILPPALGVYVEATDFLHLGAIRHYGPVAEVDLRGSGVYYEELDRLGLGPWQAIHLDQDYLHSDTKNYFKTPNTLWENRMKNALNSWQGVPAKDLTYTHWAEPLTAQYGYFLRHRGYQYWEYMGAEAAICDPLFTHFGIYLRAGFDISECSDFLLGWFGGFDFKGDDMSPAEFDEKNHRPEAVVEPVKAAVPVVVVPGPSQAELDKLKAEKDKLAKELADVKGQLSELNGLEIELPELVMFDTGSDKLRPEGKKLLDQIAQTIRTQYATQKITVEGHTDNVPVVVHKAQFTDNYGLGAARALAVLRYLKDTAKLPNIYAATSYADNKPVTANDTAAGRQQNRRAMIVLRAKK